MSNICCHPMWSMSTYHHGDLPAALLRAAARTLEKRGPGALSLRETARRRGGVAQRARTGISRIARRCSRRARRGRFAMLGERLRGQPGREMGEAYVRFALQQPQRFRLMFGGLVPMAKYPELRERRRARTGRWSRLSRIYRAGAAAARGVVAGAWSSHLLLDGSSPIPTVSASCDEVFRAVRFAQRAA